MLKIKHFIFSFIFFLLLFYSQIIFCQVYEIGDPLKWRSVEEEGLDQPGAEQPIPERGISTRNYAAHSVLSSGDWYKISVKETGIYRLTFQELEDMGIDPLNIDPRNLKLYGNGSGMLEEANSQPRPDDLMENAIYVSGEEDGALNQEDFILFYGEGPVVIRYNPFYLQFEHELNFYTDETFYFLTAGPGQGKRIPDGEPVAEAATHELYTFQDLAYHEEEKINLIKSGKIWYGEVFNTLTDYNFQFNLEGIVISEPVILKANLAARSTTKTIFNVFTEDEFLVELDIPSVLLSSQLYARAIVSNYEPFYAKDENVDIRILFEKPGSIDVAWLNYIELNYVRNLNFTGGQLVFRDMRFTGAGNILRYHLQSGIPDLKIWEITDPGSIVNQVFSQEAGGITIKGRGDILREYIAFDETSYLNAGFVEKVANQDLHALESADFIIISHPNFLEQAQRLAEHHREFDGLSYLIVTPQQIYNEFSSGAQDVSAIRDFMKMLYDRADSGEKPRYLLLFGDASYDYKKILSVADQNLVPAYQSREALKISQSFVSDEYFVCLDDDEGSTGSGTMDIGIGRFPVTTVEQAEQMVTKTINYALPNRENFGPWRNELSFIGDDKDINTHLTQAEGLASIVDSLGTVFNVNKIYLDAYVQMKTGTGPRYPDVNKAINNDINNGCLIMNYTGHGGEVALADERVLDIPAIQSFNNKNNLPLFVTATCEFSRYDDPALVSAGELVFLNPDGAGIGLFTTSRTAFSTSNYAYNKRFYYEAFKVDSATGEYPRLGDLIKAAKTPSNTNIKNLVLLGDPALMLAYPKMKVRTTDVKTGAIEQPTDTLQAMSQVTIEGQVEDLNGHLLDGFNGIVYTSVYDKPVVYTTRGNEPQSRVTDFYIQDKKIFRGEAAVKDGKFSFTFIVPLDISYPFGNGKISYYALDTLTMTDAHGYDEILVGGVDDQVIVDTEGPEVELFMNTFDFISGDLTTTNPVLLAKLYDESGINTVGNGIGHDLVAVIDGNYQEPVILNDHFTPDTDSFQSGMIQYRLGPFDNGLHTLTLKAWDVLNNSSETTIEFHVDEGARLALSQVQNRPNPYKESTSFYFQHNKPGANLDVSVNIFNLTGQHLTTLQYEIQPESTSSGLLYWDGKDKSGNELSAGLYVYTIMVKSDDGYIESISQKLLHFR